MKTSDFKELLNEKLHLSEQEYDNMFSVFYDKYGISDDIIVENIPQIGDKLFSLLPNLDSNIESTVYDTFISKELNIGEDTVAKLTSYVEVLSENKLFSGIIEKAEFEDYLGSQKEVGEKVFNAIREYNNSNGIENVVSQEEIDSVNSKNSINAVAESLKNLFDKSEEIFEKIRDSVEDKVQTVTNRLGSMFEFDIIGNMLDKQEDTASKLELLSSCREQCENIISRTDEISEKFSFGFVDKTCDWLKKESEEHINLIDEKIKDLKNDFGKDALSIALEEDKKEELAGAAISMGKDDFVDNSLDID